MTAPSPEKLQNESQRRRPLYNLHLTIQMMQMMQMAFLASPPPQKSQRITSKKTSKTLLWWTPKHHLIWSLRSPFSGHPPHTPPTYSLRSPNTTQLAPSTKAGCRIQRTAHQVPPFSSCPQYSSVSHRPPLFTKVVLARVLPLLERLWDPQNLKSINSPLAVHAHSISNLILSQELQVLAPPSRSDLHLE